MLLTKWCLDETEPAPGESYLEGNALAEPITEESNTVTDALGKGNALLEPITEKSKTVTDALEQENDPDLTVNINPETDPVVPSDVSDFIFTKEDVPAVTAPQVVLADYTIFVTFYMHF
jgi:hypothetical protein